MAKLTKPNVLRGQIFDKLAETFGDSVLGMYDGKLRIEILNEAGEPVQFSLAPVVHKNLIDEEECDGLVPIEEQVLAYNKAQESKKTKTKTDTSKKDTPSKKKEQKEEDATPNIPVAEVELSQEEQDKLDKLNALLDGNF